MAKADMMKFRELMFTDADFQEKLKNAGEAYTGDKSEKAVFDNVLIPLAKEYGLSATFEEFKEYTKAFTGSAEGELSDDELSQVAGGKGLGAAACASAGIGIGYASKNGISGGCFVFGYGTGFVACAGVGDSAEPARDKWI